MRRSIAFVASLAVAVTVAACGKTRAVADFDPAHWDDPTAANGFHELAERACGSACVVDTPHSGHAMRTLPKARRVAQLEDASPALVLVDSGCIAAGVRTDTLSGSIVCARPDSALVATRHHVGIPSALAFGDRLFAAERDLEGRSRVFAEGDVIAANETDVRTLVAHRGDVYWIADNERVRHASAPFTAMPVVTEAHATHLDARFLAVDDAGVYVVRGSSLVRLPRLGVDAPPTILATATTAISDVVLSGDWLYWTEVGDLRLTCQADGSKPSCHGRGRDFVKPHGTLHRVHTVAPFDRQTLATDLDDASGILVAHAFAYVATRRGIAKVPLTGHATPTIITTSGPAFGRPVLDTFSWTLFVQTREHRGASGAEIVAVDP